MEIINENAAMLSNYDVLMLLTDIREGRGRSKPGKRQQNLSTVVYATSKYLINTPCKHQTPEIIASFMKALQPYKLTKAEKLQLMNHRPVTAVEIQLIIEESEERLQEEQIDELIELCTTLLPADDNEEPETGDEKPVEIRQSAGEQESDTEQPMDT